jgi:tetratricopeptide (TPR) repeat protein
MPPANEPEQSIFPKDPYMGVDEDRLGQAQALYRSARLAESEALFQQLVASPTVGIAATAGIAMIKLRNGDTSSAARLFETIVRSDPHAAGFAQADAYYGLGVIARKQNSNADAAAHFQRAVAINPRHEGALKGLATLPRIEERTTVPPAPPVTPVPPVVPPAAAQEPGERTNQAAFYVILGADKSAMSQEAIKVIDSLAMVRRPRMSAFMMQVVTLVGTFVILLAALFLLAANS